jgi:hypothetical protein
MVYEESIRCGKVLGIAVPIPPPEVADDESSRVYIKFGTTADATKCREMMDGRMFDDNKVSQVADGSRAEVGHLVTSLHRRFHSCLLDCALSLQKACCGGQETEGGLLATAAPCLAPGWSAGWHHQV